MYGFLLLRKGLLTWERLYFHLDELRCTLTYALDPTTGAMGSIALDGAVVSVVKDGKGKRFAIRTKSKKEFTLKADDADLCREWVTAIFSAQMHGLLPRKSSTVNFHPSVEVCTFEAAQPRRRRANSMSSTEKKQRVMLAAVLRQRLSAGASSEDDSGEAKWDPTIRAVIKALESSHQPYHEEPEEEEDNESNGPASEPTSPGRFLSTSFEPLKPECRKASSLTPIDTSAVAAKLEDLAMVRNNGAMAAVASGPMTPTTPLSKFSSSTNSPLAANPPTYSAEDKSWFPREDSAQIEIVHF